LSHRLLPLPRLMCLSCSMCCTNKFCRFWMQEVEYLAMCVITSVATFFLWPQLQSISWLCTTPGSDDGPLCRWADTIGLGAFAVVGSQHGIRKGFHPFVTVTVATITCSFGGIIRDVFTRTAIRVLHSHAELYATAAAIGSCAYLLARLVWTNPLLRMGAGFTVTVLMRYLSWTYDWRLPMMAPAAAAAAATKLAAA
jgi:uncharacterized membrane protein YeiH